jgi:hypothetical protein
MRVFHTILAAAVLALPTQLPAQSSPAVGTWNLEWELGRSMMMGGGSTSSSSAILAKGTMQVVVSGDSLIATVTTTSRSDGLPSTRPPFTMGGRANGKGYVFTQISEATLNMNGEERKQRSVGTWTIEINGNQLTGTVSRSIEGLEIELPTTPVTGTRAG